MSYIISKEIEISTIENYIKILKPKAISIKKGSICFYFHYSSDDDINTKIDKDNFENITIYGFKLFKTSSLGGIGYPGFTVCDNVYSYSLNIFDLNYKKGRIIDIFE